MQQEIISTITTSELRKICAKQSGLGQQSSQNSSLQLVDVRTPREFTSSHIPEARNIPLDTLINAQDSLLKAEPVYLICASGKRSAIAAKQLLGFGFTQVINVEGGMGAWSAESQENTAPEAAPFPSTIERQVRFIAGVLVLLGLSLAAIYDKAFLALTAFVGIGLTLSGLTNFCAMALLLQRLPWNKGRFACRSCK